MTADRQTIEPLLLSASQTAALLGIGRSAFYSLLSSGRLGPLPIRLGRSVRWRAEELRDWCVAGCPAREVWLRASLSQGACRGHKTSVKLTNASGEAL